MTIVFQDDFESEDFSNWTGIGGVNVPVIATAPSGMTGHAAQLKLSSSYFWKSGVTPCSDIRLTCKVKRSGSVCNLLFLLSRNYGTDGEGIRLYQSGGILYLLQYPSQDVLAQAQPYFSDWYSAPGSFDVRLRMRPDNTGICQVYVNGLVGIDYRGPISVDEEAIFTDYLLFGHGGSFDIVNAYVDDVVLDDSVVFVDNIISESQFILQNDVGLVAESAHLFEINKSIGGVSAYLLESHEWPATFGQRTFPLPKNETKWQSQLGKRKFPLPGEQS